MMFAYFNFQIISTLTFYESHLEYSSATVLSNIFLQTIDYILLNSCYSRYKSLKKWLNWFTPSDVMKKKEKCFVKDDIDILLCAVSLIFKGGHGGEYSNGDG